MAHRWEGSKRSCSPPIRPPQKDARRQIFYVRAQSKDFIGQARISGRTAKPPDTDNSHRSVGPLQASVDTSSSLPIFSSQPRQHNVASVRLVANAEWGFALLFAVGVAMVTHSLRSHSEVT